MVSTSITMHSFNFFYLFKKYFIYLFLVRVEGKEEERERNIDVWLPPVCPLLGTWLTSEACALTGSWASDPLVHRPVLNPLSHTKQSLTLKKKKLITCYKSETLLGLLYKMLKKTYTVPTLMEVLIYCRIYSHHNCHGYHHCHRHCYC